MRRLIDADVAEKMLRTYADEVGCHRGEYELANGILKAVCYLENIPTAYDVNKVVELLEDKLEELEDISKDMVLSEEQKRQNYGYLVAMNHAIEIVKGGGVDEN